MRINSEKVSKQGRLFKEIVYTIASGTVHITMELY